MNPSYLSTQNFANLCHTTKDTLRHYDEIGLLSPAYISPSKYHYYTIIQLYKFELIQLLSELGCPLQTIKEKLNSYTNEELLSYFEEEGLRLEQIKNKLQYSKFYLSNILQLEHQPDSSQLTQPHILQQSYDETLITTCITPPTPEALNLEALNKHQQSCMANHIHVYPLGHIIDTSLYLKGELFRTAVFSYAPDTFTQKDKVIIKKSGTYLCIFHMGSADTLVLTYQKLRTYIMNHHLEVSDFLLELNISDCMSFSPNKDECYYLSVQIK